MDKFLNLMYDFFAFAFPGACILGSLLLVEFGSLSLFERIPGAFTQGLWQCFLFFSFSGYVIGYVLNPLARVLLLRKLGLNIYKGFLNGRDSGKNDKANIEPGSLKNNRYLIMKKYLNSNDLSSKFVLIREYSPRNAQYIEFWDMHVSMSLNLAIASLVFLMVFLYNKSMSGICDELELVIPVTVILLVVFFTFIWLAVKYSVWWVSDVITTYKLVNNKRFKRKMKSSE